MHGSDGFASNFRRNNNLSAAHPEQFQSNQSSIKNAVGGAAAAKDNKLVIKRSQIKKAATVEEFNHISTTENNHRKTDSMDFNSKNPQSMMKHGAEGNVSEADLD